MPTDPDAERAAIHAAIERLFAGTPCNSTGALTVLQLAAEAGVKRWVLTHKHTDLKDAFLARRAAHDGVPPAFRHLVAANADLTAHNRRLRADNTRLQEQVAVYAQVISELLTERDRLQTSALPLQRLTNTHVHPPRWPTG